MSDHKHNPPTYYGYYGDIFERKDNKLHSKNGKPAIVMYDREHFREGYESWTISNVELEEWYFEGKLHREQSSRGEDGPARIKYKIVQGGYHKRSLKVLEEWYQHGKLHRESGPAVIIYDDDEDEDGIVLCEKWYADGELYRETKYQDEDEENLVCNCHEIYKTYEDTWYKNGKKHRDDGPAYIYRMRDWIKWFQGTNKYTHEEDIEEWYTHGELHRIDGPASIKRSCIEDIKSTTEEWYIQGKLHREQSSRGEDGPAYTSFDSIGDKNTQKWYTHGELHRMDGPAIVYSDDSCVKESYYRYGLKFEI